MHTINDYVRFIADSLGVKLSEEKINKLGIELINDEKYVEVLHNLENKIFEMRKSKWRNK